MFIKKHDKWLLCNVGTQSCPLPILCSQGSCYQSLSLPFVKEKNNFLAQKLFVWQKLVTFFLIPNTSKYHGFCVYGPCFVVQYLVSSLVLQSSHWGKEGCLLNCSHVAVSVHCLFLMVPWVGLQCLIVA